MNYVVGNWLQNPILLFSAVNSDFTVLSLRSCARQVAEDERCLFTAGNKLDLWEFLKCGKNSGNASAKVSAVMPGLTGASGADFRISINVKHFSVFAF